MQAPPLWTVGKLGKLQARPNGGSNCDSLKVAVEVKGGTKAQTLGQAWGSNRRSHGLGKDTS